LVFALASIVSCKSEMIQDTPAPGAPASSAPPQPFATVDPQDPFAPYPGATELCNRLIIAEGRPLRWRSWTVADDWSKVIAYYKEHAKGIAVRESTEKVEFPQTPTRVLTIYPAKLASKHPQCDKPLAPEDKTVVMLSETKMP
jgi:hypothetical protein